MSANGGWIGVDLDGTLAHYDGWKGVEDIGAPVPAMVERVRRWLKEGLEVRIVTARVSALYRRELVDAFVQRLPEMVADAQAAEAAIIRWCKKHLGQALPVVALKDFGMVELWDDRAVQVIPNTGLRVDTATEAEFDALTTAPPAFRQAVEKAAAIVLQPCWCSVHRGRTPVLACPLEKTT